MRTIREINEDRKSARERRDRMKSQAEELHRAAAGDELTGGSAERFENLTRGLAKVDGEIERLDDEWREVFGAQYANDPAKQESGHNEGPPQGNRSTQATPHNRARDEALRTIERAADLSPEAGDRLTNLVERDSLGVDSRYLSAVGDAQYAEAFGTILQHGPSAHLRMSREQVEAVQRVTQAMSERALSTGVGAEGGFAVPFALDPTIILTSDGSVNPLRQLARVRTITSNEWKGVDSTGISAAYADEGAEVGDNTPALGQPAFKPQRAHAFVPFSIEIGQDWSALQAELGELFRDAKDQLEAEQFVNGDGVAPNPEGLVAGLPAGSLVNTAAASAYAVGDVYALEDALPSQFVPRATFLASNAIINNTYRFVGTGDPDEPRLVNDDRTRILGKPLSEVSTMDATVVAGNDILVYGDINRAFQITDRIGMSVELVGHLFGAAGRPTGQRGLYAFWRNTAGVLVANAVRALRVAAA
jgi:HK97 family phage major capsid protein